MVSIDLSLLGGGYNTLASGGSATDLRAGLEALAAEAGAVGAEALITNIAINETTVTPSQLQDLSTSTISAADVLAQSGSTRSSTLALNASDALNSNRTVTANNGARRMRAGAAAAAAAESAARKLQAGTGCNPSITQNVTTTSVTLPVATVTVQLELPASLLASAGGNAALAVARLQRRLVTLLSQPSVVQRTLSTFLTSWGACTGLPATPSAVVPRATTAIVSIGSPASPAAASSPPPSASTLSSGATIGIIIGTIAAVLALLIIGLALTGRICTCCLCCCCCAVRRRRSGAVLKTEPPVTAGADGVFAFAPNQAPAAFV